jgi:acyl-CoA oxidase
MGMALSKPTPGPVDITDSCPRADSGGLPSDMASHPTNTAEHLRNTLDGRWRDAKNEMRLRLSDEIFQPHYTPNTVIARTKVAEQLKIMAGRGAAEDGFKKEHGGNGDVGAAVTQIEMLALSDLSLMV